MPKGLKRAASALAIAVGLYSLLGFLILPGIALRVANQQLANYAAVPASLQRIQLNPFTLELSVWGLNIGEADKQQVGFERLYADLQLDSAWKRYLHLANVELDSPKTEVLFDKEGNLNLAQLFNIPPSNAPEPAEPSEPFPMLIERIKLTTGNVHFQDLRPSEPIEFLYDDLSFELFNLSTLPDDNAEMNLVALGPYGGRIDWTGTLSLIPFKSSGSLKITDGKLKAVWPYVRDAVPLVLEDGSVNLSSDYTVDLSKGTELLLNNAQVAVTSLAIKTPADKPLIRVQSLEVSETSVDLAKQQVVVGKIRSNKLETWAAREADGQLDWQKLFASQPAKAEPKAAAITEPSTAQAAAPATTETADNAEPAAAQAATEPAANEPAKPWQVILRDVQMRDYNVHLADRADGAKTTVDLAPLNIDITDFDSLGTSPFDLKIDTGVNKSGTLKAEGQVQLTPTTAKLKVSTRDIDLRVAQSYISPFVRLELRSGMLSSDLNANLQSTEPLAFSVDGQAQINQLHTLDTIKDRDLLKWRQVQVDGINYQHGKGLAINQIKLQQPYVRFIINEDMSTNISELVIEQKGSGTAQAPTNSKAAAEKPMPIRIGGISIQDGSANFADFSLQPNFATAIGQMNGQIGTLDNQSPKAAAVDIKGKVDKYAPVTIKGKLTPFDPMNSLDIATSFKNVELANLTPYSGKFAGLSIRKGRLNLDLHYQIEQGKLNAENKLLLENLQLGDKIESKDAMDLPIRLAVALLKDTKGNIEISLPVTGDLNNPEFSVMPIVWQTLRNLVLRAAQAPFKFIGGLVAGGNDVDLGSVTFAAGSDELNGSAQKSLDTLASALKERPALRLEIEGKSSASSDGPLVAAARLEREYQNNWYKILQRRGDKVPADASELVVDEDDKEVLIEGIYRTRLKQQPPAEWKELPDEERISKMRDAVIQSWAQNQTLLRQLGVARSSAIKDYLVERGGLPDTRLLIIESSQTEANSDGSVSTSLHLDSE
ncbi:DUF748 domain-containing protein [Pseudomonas sp. TTU2014-080ASC]|uniref:DUF748 domain-containing protein n=1 Tax=Pseudomonas sp. TTU2014-080ASC TaxID=1729724 RepID=UPI0007184CEB|nr:DUF748 domain-containing protein [Pseudomonas sp. TTU2014-080ASC]KRW59235.1 hypothetical protein AO726_10360 [Pseudomonas sp. TTU2014-080ASC]